MAVNLPGKLQKQLFTQMEATYPNEGGGFLLGSVDGGTVTIAAVTQVTNVFETEEQYHRYAMSPQDWARLEDEADEQGLALVGYYHSHPDAAAIPSEYDRVHALPNFIYLITSVQQGAAVDMRAWQLDADRAKFTAETLQVTVEEE
jgi:proteasome lid subunit RPN8/RPN11